MFIIIIIIIITLLATSFGLKRPTSGQYLQKQKNLNMLVHIVQKCQLGNPKHAHARPLRICRLHSRVYYYYYYTIGYKFRPQKANIRPIFTKKKLKMLVHIVQKCQLGNPKHSHARSLRICRLHSRHFCLKPSRSAETIKIALFTSDLI